MWAIEKDDFIRGRMEGRHPLLDQDGGVGGVVYREAQQPQLAPRACRQDRIAVFRSFICTGARRILESVSTNQGN